MAKEIAVFLDSFGNTTSLNVDGKVVVYGKGINKWSIIRKKDFPINKNLGLGVLRNRLTEIVAFIGECKTFVGSGITGIAYFALEKAGCSIWEFEGDPEGFLDYVWEKETETEEANLTKLQSISPIIVPAPVTIAPGHYRISIKEVQENNNTLTSKQVLMPLLRKGDFDVLEVICNHVPMWLENELLSHDFIADTSSAPFSDTRVLISKKVCSDIYVG